MDHYLRNYLGETVSVEVAGGRCSEGVLVDYGTDVIVIYDGKLFYYISLMHMRSIKLSYQSDTVYGTSHGDRPINAVDESLSLKKVVENAKGLLVEIYVTGSQSVHGYIDNIFNDYFTFVSPLYKTMFVAFKHFKWLALLNRTQTYYTLPKEQYPVQPNLIQLQALDFEELLLKLRGKIVIFDMGVERNKAGLISGVQNSFVELINADEETVSLNIHHIKIGHMP